MSVAVYPGSFDPVTNGHLDVVERAVRVFDRVIVAVLANPRRSPSVDERSHIGTRRRGDRRRRVRSTVRGLRRVRRQRRRFMPGLRAISDFETEMQLAHNNRRLAPDIDSVFFMTSVEHGYVSSSLVKEIARFGGDVSAMVPASVVARLREVAGG
jgi:pantetheine-phosphate adenylyltransferase